MLEFSVDVICAELVEDTSVKNADSNSINSKEKPQQDIKAVLHYPKPDFVHRVPTVVKIALKQVYLAKVEDWVFRRKHAEVDGGFFGELTAQVLL
jgi:hypothetical protein